MAEGNDPTAATVPSKYSEEQQAWRKSRQEQDEKREKVVQKINQFPNLFSLCPRIPKRDRCQYILKKLESELQTEGFHFDHETLRCQNVIVFLHFVLGQKDVAVEKCEAWRTDKSQRDIIHLTNLAMLQWDTRRTQECKRTLEMLQKLNDCEDIKYLRTVATAEKGYACICFGPPFFLRGVEFCQEAINNCEQPELDIYVWKYDLALAIRRHFNLFVYSDPLDKTPSSLASKANDFLLDVSENCPDSFYQGRALVELGDLVSHLKQFKYVCNKFDKEVIEKLAEQDPMKYFNEALKISKGDYYVLRSCGRHYFYSMETEKAIDFLVKSRDLNENTIVYQLLAKAMLKYYDNKHNRTPRHYGYPVGSEKPTYSTMNLNTSSYRSSGFQVPARLVLDGPRGTNSIVQESSSLKVSPREPTHNVCADNNELHLETEFERRLTIGRVGGVGETPKSGQVGSVGETPKSGHVGSVAMQARSFDAIPAVSSEACTQQRKTQCLRSLLKCRIFTHKRYDANDIDVKGAEAFYLKSLEINPHNNGALYDMGIMYQDMKMPEKALNLFNKIIHNEERNVNGEEADLKPRLHLVNAYERSGLCLVEMSQKFKPTSEDNKRYLDRAEEMLMSSLSACRAAVADFPEVRDDPSILWKSYSIMISLLQGSTSAPENHRRMNKMASVHEFVGNYMEAVKVYQDELELLDLSTKKRIKTSFHLALNYHKGGNNWEARHILDLVFCSEEGHSVLTDDSRTIVQLRRQAADIYIEGAKRALENDIIPEARKCFQRALSLQGLGCGLQAWRLASKDGSSAGQEQRAVAENCKFDLCVFDDDTKGYFTDQMDQATTAIVTVTRNVFGMRVTQNDEAVNVEYLEFDGQLTLAREASRLVLFVLPSGEPLSPRMVWLANHARMNHRPECMLLVTMGNPPQTTPDTFRGCRSFETPLELLTVLYGATTDRHSQNRVVLRLFDFIINSSSSTSR